MSETMEEIKRQVRCRNCGSSILADSEKCLFCGSHQMPGRVPFFQYLSESRIFRRVFLFPFSILISLSFPILKIVYPEILPEWSWIPFISGFFLLFAVFGFISEWIFLHKAKGEAKDFRQGFFEWQKTLYVQNRAYSYLGMFLFVCVPLLDWANSLAFAASASAIWSLILLFLSKVLIPLF